MECTNWNNQYLGRALRKAYDDIVVTGGNLSVVKDAQDYYEEANRRLAAYARELGLKIEKTTIIKD